LVISDKKTLFSYRFLHWNGFYAYIDFEIEVNLLDERVYLFVSVFERVEFYRSLKEPFCLGPRKELQAKMPAYERIIFLSFNILFY